MDDNEYFNQFKTNDNIYVKNGPKMRERDLVFMDLETTGLSIDNEIIEIGWLRVDSNTLEIKEEFEIKIKPKRLDLADPKALEINGYNEEDWKNGVSIQEAMRIFIDKCSGCVLCGYNFFYDWAWLHSTFNKLGAVNPPFYYHKLDVMSIAYLVLKDEPSLNNFSLSDVCRFLDINREKCHTALYDAKFAFEVYKKLYIKLKEIN